jgi:uncharacterized membrane protein YqjE
MAREPMRFRNPAGHAGILNNLLALLNSLAGFVESRIALFTKESKIALVQGLVLAGALLGAFLLFALGYIFLVAAAIVGIARLAQISWLWTALGAAGVHFLLALICLLIARAKATRAPFRETAAELKKDREWLKHLDETTRLTS